MRSRGVSDEHIGLMRHCGIDLDSWLHGFDRTDDAVRETVDLVKKPSADASRRKSRRLYHRHSHRRAVSGLPRTIVRHRYK